MAPLSAMAFAVLVWGTIGLVLAVFAAVVVVLVREFQSG